MNQLSETLPPQAKLSRPKIEFLFDAETRTVVHSQMLDYHLAWYNQGKVVAVTPRNKPDITYLVDLEDNKKQMSCTCDTFMYKADPQLPGYIRVPFKPCRHILLVKLAIKRGLLTQ